MVGLGIENVYLSLIAAFYFREKSISSRPCFQRTGFERLEDDAVCRTIRSTG